MRILIVEDNTDSRLVLQKNLEHAGHTAISAVNGRDALEKAREQRPDLIISDILMPEMDGFRLCQEIKSDERLRGVPFVFYTATYVDPEDERLALSLGASRFILKPAEPGTFLELIDEVIRDARNKQLDVPAGPVARPVELLGMYENSLARKLDEKVRQLEIYKNIFDNSQEAICVLDPDGKIRLVNSAQQKIFGFTSEELLGKPASLLLGEEAGTAIMAILAQRGAYGGETPARTKSGELRHLDLSAFPIHDERGKATALVLMLRDLTEQKSLEAQFRQAQRMEAVGRLTGGIAHDFNNILTVIAGFSGLLQMGLADTDPNNAHLSQIITAVERAKVLTKGLLAFSRKQVLDQRPADLNGIVVGLDQLMHHLIGEQVALRVLLHSRPLVSRVDSGQIEQVLMNLATNARDAMPQGGTLTIETGPASIDDAAVRASGYGRAGEYALLTVCDTGCGMDEQTRSKIFDPFFTTKEVGKGTGLGLATVYGIVKQHGGYVACESAPGKGATFRIWLPLLETETPAAVVVEKGTEEFPHGTETVLIADDNAPLRLLACTVLRQYGYRVLEAADGGEALARFREQGEAVQLLLLDLVMPKLNGREVLARIERIRPGVKALFMSGYAAEVLSEESGLASETEILPKPFSAGDLLRRVRAVLDR